MYLLLRSELCLLYTLRDAETGFSLKAHCLVALLVKFLIEAFRKFQNTFLRRNNTLEQFHHTLHPLPPQLLQRGREDLAEDERVLAKPLLCLLWFLCLPNKMFLLLICYRIGS